ncbi:alpha/beta hydrolase [Corynebacterium timonense]|uniref:Alpha/beta hydrolase n=1 Tax=Corynebacterium timonense TaxID=441500 RepID=A0A1H1VJ68_9CORY|nr:alpha/beta hydrolase [Corynebacterium timonense]SDS84391.1 Alpha/beta hydrolase [Corynebacterium timonense]
MTAYAPPLKAAELTSAAGTLRAAAAALTTRAADTSRAADLVARTGFAGPAAAAGLSRLTSFGEAFLARAALYHHAARILSEASSAQEKLDAFAELAIYAQRAQVIEWLNMMAWLLDTATAVAVDVLALDETEAQFDELVHRPFDSLEDIHAGHLATLPASTASTITDAGGLILEAGPGRTSVLVGDHVDPARVTTLVAGVSTGQPHQLAGELAKARRIAEATGGAVVVWQGYVPPPDVPRGLDPSAARRGGDALAAFQLAVEERFPAARKSVVAHSYGTVVAARAAGGPGLYADDLWLLGSPGVPVASTAEMTLLGDAPEVFVVDADSDPIGALRFGDRAVHGASPSHPSFGARVVGGVEGGHSAYFDDPDFLRALTLLPCGGEKCTHGG